jgi:DNA-binding NarL/FixJ family response regulator
VIPLFHKQRVSGFFVQIPVMNSKNLVVLVVEDSLLIIERIFTLLEETDNIKLVVHAANYAESIKMIKEVEANVVLLDINLPDKSGIELLQVIKANHPGMKVIMLTNHATESYREICTYMGADYFLDKSNEFDKIPEAIRALN